MAKAVAFIGLAGPFGYDYRNPAPRVNDSDGSSPNPVLENVLGLLLCYDELIFLAPQFCPADMRELAYVKFITDDPASLAAVQLALERFDQLAPDRWGGADFARFSGISSEMVGKRQKRFAIDNHTHGIEIGGTRIVGNSMRLDNAFRDLWIVAELGLSHADVIFSSPAQEALNSELELEIAGGHYFGPVKRVAATTLATLQVPNFLGRRGSYHEALEAIRARPDVSEFRQYLLELEAPTEDGVRLAKEISAAAFDTVDELSRRFLKGQPLFRSVGVPAVRGVLNSVSPGLGSAVAFGLDAPFRIGDSRFKSASRWAPFVVSLSRPTLENRGGARR